MKKCFLRSAGFFSLIFFLSASANAQLGIVKKPGITLGGNFIYAMPQGNFKGEDAYKFGVGGELYGGVGWGSTYLVATVGYTAYKPQSGFKNTLSAVPVKVGLKKYFLLKKLFINGDLGVSSIKVSGSSASAFTAGAGAGVRLLGLELALYYNAFQNKVGYSTTGYSNSINAKIGWSFTL